VALTLVLDTNAILYLLNSRLAEPLPATSYFVSVITRIELLSFQQINPAEEQQARAFLSRATVVGLDQDVELAAIELRRRYGLKLPDAIIAATAVVLGMELATNDRRLANIPELTIRHLRLTDD
jgi:predicted nucleic acid-binding protein